MKTERTSTVRTGEESGIKYWIRKMVRPMDSSSRKILWYTAYILWPEKPKDLVGFLAGHEVTFCHPVMNISFAYRITREEKASGQIIGWDYMDRDPAPSEVEVLEDVKFEIRRLLSNRDERLKRAADPEHYAVEEIKRHLGISLPSPKTAVAVVQRWDVKYNKDAIRRHLRTISKRITARRIISDGVEITVPDRFCTVSFMKSWADQCKGLSQEQIDRKIEDQILMFEVDQESEAALTEADHARIRDVVKKMEKAFSPELVASYLEGKLRREHHV